VLRFFSGEYLSFQAGDFAPLLSNVIYKKGLHMKSKKVKNPNSLENLLAPWINANTRRFFEHGNGDSQAFGRILLLHILDLAESHNKLIEMYDWLESRDASDFLFSELCDPAGEWISNAFDYLTALIDRREKMHEEFSEKLLKEVISDYYEHWEPLRYRLELEQGEMLRL